MPSPDITPEWQSLIAKAADVCIKPWTHAVVIDESASVASFDENIPLDITILIHARSKTGERITEQDIELEIFKSSGEINVTLSWYSKSNSPILWQGKHPVWMDGDSGIKVEPPADSHLLESLARKVRALFIN